MVNTRNDAGEHMGERYCALALGIVFILLGVVGFIPAFVSVPAEGGAYVPPATVPGVYGADYGNIFGLFPTNIVHNLVHLIVGFTGIIAYPDARASRVYCRVFAYAYTVLAILGLIPFARELFGLIPIFGNNVWFNALTALIAAYFGFIKPSREINTTA